MPLPRFSMVLSLTHHLIVEVYKTLEDFGRHQQTSQYLLSESNTRAMHEVNIIEPLTEVMLTACIFCFFRKISAVVVFRSGSLCTQGC